MNAVTAAQADALATTALSSSNVDDEPVRTPNAQLLYLGQLMNERIAAERAAWPDGAEDACGDDPVSRERLRLNRETGQIVDMINCCGATTLGGFVVKLRALSWCKHGVGVTREQLHKAWNEVDWANEETVLAGILVDVMDIVSSNPDAELLALRPEYDRLVGEAETINYGDGIPSEADYERAVEPFIDLCERVIAMPAATTARGKAFKAAAAYQFLRAHDCQKDEALEVLLELSQECGQ